MTIALLVDNDIVIKLARMNAYEDSITSAGLKTSQVGSIGVMLRYMGRASERNRLGLTDGSQIQAESLKHALHSIAEIEPTEQESKLAAAVMKAALVNDVDMQEGELTLMVVAATRGQIEVATGDKRALRSLPALHRHWTGVANLQEKFICLEQLIKVLCKKQGLKRVRDAVATAPDADATIKFIFDRTVASGEAHFIAALDYYTNEQIRSVAPGWLKR